MRKWRLVGLVPREAGRVTRSRPERRALVRFHDRRFDKWRRKAAAIKRLIQGLRAPDSLGRNRKLHWNAEVEGTIAEGIQAIGNVREVCRGMKMASSTLYMRRKNNPVFAYHWEKAQTDRYDEIESFLLKVALEGWDEEVWHEGKCVGIRRRHDPRLGLRLLQQKMERDQNRRDPWFGWAKRPDAAATWDSELFADEVLESAAWNAV